MRKPEPVSHDHPCNCLQQRIGRRLRAHDRPSRARSSGTARVLRAASDECSTRLWQGWFGGEGAVSAFAAAGPRARRDRLVEIAPERRLGARFSSACRAFCAPRERAFCAPCSSRPDSAPIDAPVLSRGCGAVGRTRQRWATRVRASSGEVTACAGLAVVSTSRSLNNPWSGVGRFRGQTPPMSGGVDQAAGWRWRNTSRAT